MIYEPKVGDLLVRYASEGTDVSTARVDAVETWGPDATYTFAHLAEYDMPLVWTSAGGYSDGWRLVARGAVPLAERPPVPERDERSEVERLRAEVAELRGAERAADAEIERLRRQIRDNGPPWFTQLLGALGWTGGTIHDALAAVARLSVDGAVQRAAGRLDALAEQEERGRPDVAFAKGVRAGRAEADAEIDRLRDELMSAAAVRGTLRAWREGCDSGEQQEQARVLAVLRERARVWGRRWNVENIMLGDVAKALGFTPEELSAERVT